MRARRGGVLVVVAVLLVSLLGLPAVAAQGSGVDLAVGVKGPASNPARGDSFEVEVTLRNVGSAPATDVTLATYIPEGLTRDSHASSTPGLDCSATEFGEFACTLGTVRAGESVTVILTLTRTMARETWIDAWGSTPEAETNFDNNYSGIYLDPDRSNPADVAVTVDLPAQADPGEEFDYTATVTNRGPERARDVTFTQSLSELVDYVAVQSSDPTDTCTLHEDTYDAEGLEGGPYVYREVRCALGNMAFAEQATITVTVVRTDPHELWSSAWVATSSWDQNYENDWADAVTAGHPSVTSDLSLTFTRSETSPMVGDDFEYLMTVANLGPATAPDVMATSWLPEELVLRSITAEDPAHACEQDQYRGINCTVPSLASGDSASFTIAVTRVRAREIYMGANVWSTNYDPNFENGYVEDLIDADKSVPADVGVTMTGPKNPAVGSSFDYVITVSNEGPMAATGTFLAASVPDGASYVSSSSDVADACTLFEETYDTEMSLREGEGPSTYTYRELRCDLGTLAPGASTAVTMTVTRDSEYVLWGNAWIATASYDANYENDYASIPSEGKDFDGCVMPVEDGSGAAASRPIACDYAGAEQGRDGSGSFYAPPSKGSRKIKMGSGNDTLTVKVPKSGKKHRELVIKAGRGNDTVDLLIAPGAGNISILVRGGRGRDHLQVHAPRPGTGLKIKMWGGPGRDICESQRGDKYRKRHC